VAGAFGAERGETGRAGADARAAGRAGAGRLAATRAGARAGFAAGRGATATAEDRAAPRLGAGWDKRFDALVAVCRDDPRAWLFDIGRSLTCET
jgi:hypothetical protein